MFFMVDWWVIICGDEMWMFQFFEVCVGMGFFKFYVFLVICCEVIYLLGNVVCLVVVEDLFNVIKEVV